MRIVHLTSNHRPTDIRIFRKQCRSLAALGHDITYIVPSDSNATVDDVTIHAIRPPRSRMYRLLITPIHALLAALQLEADIYHIHDPELLPMASLLRLLRPKSAVVYDMHENMPLALRSMAWIPRYLRRPAARLYSLVERALLSGLPVVYAEDSYEKYYPFIKLRTTVRNFPLIEEVLHHQVSSSEQLPQLVYIGGVTPLRGSRTMLEVLRVLHDRGHEMTLRIIGPVDENELSLLQARAFTLQLEDSIEFLGYLPPSEAWSKAAAASFGLALLSPEPNYLESFPTKVFEYMALGLVVICSNFPLYRTLMESTSAGSAVDPTNPTEIATEIERYISDSSLRLDSRQKGIEAVTETYNWGAEFSKLESLYQDVLTKRLAGNRE